MSLIRCMDIMAALAIAGAAWHILMDWLETKPNEKGFITKTLAILGFAAIMAVGAGMAFGLLPTTPRP